MLLCVVCSMLVQPAFAAYGYEPAEDLKNECGVTFDSNGGYGTMEPLWYNGSFKLPECEFTAPEGYRFKGWQWNGEMKQPGDAVYLDSVRTAVAMWEKVSEENIISAPAGGDGTMYILAQPQNYVYNEGAVAIYYVTVAGENLKCTWYLDFEDKTYDLTAGSSGPWLSYVTGDCGGAEEQDNLGFTPSHTTFSYFFNGCEAGLNGAYIYAVIDNGQYMTKSSKAMIQLSAGAKSPPNVFVPAEMEVYKGDKVELECSATAIYGGRLSYTWYETPDGDLTKIQAINRGKETNATLVCDTNSYGTRYYVCSVEEAGGGSAYSSVISVTVMESQPTEPDNATEPVTEPRPAVPENTESVTEPEASENTEATTLEKTEKKEPAEKNDKVWTYVALALGVVVVGMGVAIVLLLKKKK